MKCPKCGIDLNNTMDENIHAEWHKWCDTQEQ